MLLTLTNMVRYQNTKIDSPQESHDFGEKMGKSWQINVLAQAIITRSLFLLSYSHYLLNSTLFVARVITSIELILRIL